MNQANPSGSRSSILSGCVILGLLGCLATSCSGTDGNPNNDPSVLGVSRSGVGSLSVRLVDGPVDAKQVRVVIDQFSVHPCSGGGWLSVPVSGQEYDLLTLQGGSFAGLADNVQLPAGEYCELRVTVQNPAAMVLKSGEEVTLKVPSGEIKFKGRFFLVPHLNTALVVDFDAAESIHEAGNKYVMNPVIHLRDVQYSGQVGESVPGATLADFVTFSVTPTTAGVVPLPGGATLEFQAGAVTEDVQFVATMWMSPLNDALAPTYTFAPSYTFLASPKFTTPMNTANSQARVLLDYEPLATTLALQNGVSSAAALVPHFSCASVVRTFDGLPDGQWYSGPIVSMDTLGVFDRQEFHNDFFNPDPQVGNNKLPIRRDEMIGLIARSMFKVEAEKLPQLVSKPFADVEISGQAANPFAKYIADLKTRGVIAGCGDGTSFCVGKLNRAELAKIVVEALDKSGRNKKPAQWATDYAAHPITGNGDESEYTDVHCTPGSTCDWYYGYVYAARRAGLMTGDGAATTFRPADSVNRAEAAAVACRLAYGTDQCESCWVSFQRLASVYPYPGGGHTQEVADMIGGKVGAGFGPPPDGWYDNTCAIRLSRAFNYSGLPIPKDFPGDFNNVMTGADGLWYAYRVKDFPAWLTSEFGQPRDYTKNKGDSFDLSALPTGVIVFDIAAWSDATGHADLLDENGHCIGHCVDGDGTPYENLATRIRLWKID